MKKLKQNKTIIISVFGLLFNQTAHAGAFSLYTESSAAAIGNFAAGVAAEGRDASIGWFNPAGLVLIKEEQAVFSGVGVFPSTIASGTSIFETDTFDPYIQNFNTLQGAESAAVPAFHYARPLGERATFGFSVVSPFGLSTNWGESSPIRYSATYTQLLTVDASPELGGKITDNFSAGLGLDLQWARVAFNSVLGSPAALEYLQSIGGEVTPTTLDSTTNNNGTSFGIGFHAGILGVFNDNHTRLGANYQSGISHQFQGTSTLTGRLADPELTSPDAVFSTNTLISNEVQLPDILTLSAYQDLTSKWALLTSIVYTGWSSFNQIELNNVAAFSDETGTQALVNTTSSENYRDSWRFAMGLNYQAKDWWMMRAGVGFDQTPTINQERDMRLPDSNRLALSIGSHFQLRHNLGLDVGYTYLFGMETATINKFTQLGPTADNIIDATADNHAQLFGLQLVWAI